MRSPVSGRSGGKFASVAQNIQTEEAPLRPAMRDDDPRARAAQRAAELRDHLNGEVVDAIDDFYIPPDMVPDGWAFEWKRHSVFGKEDTTYYIQLRREGWEPVAASRYPEMMPSDAGSGPILRKGMILMECPLEIVEERRRAEQIRARNQVRHKEAQIAGTPDGTMTRDDARVRPQIKKSYEAMPIPDK